MALYGLGLMGNSARAQLGGLGLLFFNQLLGIDAWIVSLIISLSMIFDAFLDPLIGHCSDETRTRWGRRHPYTYAAAIPAAIFYTLVFMPPRSWSQSALVGYLIVVIILQGALASLGELPNSALLPELTQDYDRRTTLQSYRYFFSTVLGATVSIVLGFGVFLRGTKAQPFGQLNEAGYAPYAATISIVGALALIASGVATHRFIPHLHRPDSRKAPRVRSGSLVAILANRNLAVLAGSAMIFGMTQGISKGLLTYFYTYFWEFKSWDIFQLNLWALPGGLLGVVIAPIASRAWDKRGVAVATLLATILTTTVPIVGRLLGLMPLNGSGWLLPIMIVDGVATNVVTVIGLVILGSMLADVVEDSQTRTGRRSEGLLFSMQSLLQKFTMGFSALIPGLIISAIHFPNHARPGAVDAAILRHLAFIYLPLLAGLSMCGTIVLLFYRISRSRHEENLRRIADTAAALEESGEEAASTTPMASQLQ